MSVNPEVTYLPRAAILDAADRFETPFFLYEEKKLRANCQTLKNAFESVFSSFEPLFAVKANPNPQLLKIIMDEGFGFDASSYSEAWLAKKLGASGMYTGNYTLREEFAMALEAGLIVNLDDLDLLPMLEKLGVPETLSFRINPGIGKGGKENIVLAGPDAKFGVHRKKACEAFAKVRDLGVKRFGMHMMTGSNVLDEQYFYEIVAKQLEIAAEIRDSTGIEIEFLNLGGGFGVPYRPEEESLDLKPLAKGIREVFDRQRERFDLHEPTIMVEPGRFIGATAGWLVTRVNSIKDSYKKFVGVDACSNDMPRPSIYDAYHYVTALNEETEKESVSVVGRICENSDQFAKDRELPVCRVGDVLAIHNCGAHAYAMGHNYNGQLKHAEYLLTLDGSIRRIRRAETLDDLFSTVTFD